MSHLLLLLLLMVANIYVAAQQPGFLSLDCGAYENHTDGNGIEWMPDDNYITTGVPASISSSLNNNTNRLWHRLRYFKDTSRKHCYALPVVVNESYIARMSFYYGNYDEQQSSLSKFDIMIGANNVITTYLDFKDNQLHYYYYEFVVKTTSLMLDLCLGTRSKAPENIPFISAIELRKLDPTMNSLDSSELLIMWGRVNLGAATELEYPKDVYDRIWIADENMGNYQRINTTSNVSPGKALGKPPTAVMSSAITSNSTIIFQFPYTLDTMPMEYYASFYFAEFGNNKREFRVLYNTSSLESRQLLATVDVQAPLTSMQVTAHLMLSGPTYFFFEPTTNSTLGPILNAAELFIYKGGLLPGTEPNDATAIREVMNDFHITGWSGDPCLPANYTWSWITCDLAQTPARIIEL